MSNAILAELVHQSYIVGETAQAGTEPSSSSVRAVADGVRRRIVNKTLPTFLPDMMDRAPVVPFMDGSHVHLDQGQRQTCRCDTKALKIINHGWQIPPPDFDLLNRQPAVCDHFGVAFLDAIARHLCGPSKEADCMVSAVSDAGKSTLCSALSSAMPGAIVATEAASVLTGAKKRFSVHTLPLTRARIVLFDECGKVKPRIGKIPFSS